MSNLQQLDEALDYLNDNKRESTNEGVLATIGTIIVAPYLFLALVILISALCSGFKNIKYNTTISKNPNVTKAIKNFAIKCQDQFKKSMSKFIKYFKPESISISSKNFTKDKVRVVLGKFDYGLNPEDLYEAVAPAIYDEMDEDDRIDRFGENHNREDAINDIVNNPNYFECDYNSFIKGDVNNIIKKKYPELIEAIDAVNKSTKEINNFIYAKSNSKNIYVAIDNGNTRELTLDYLLNSHFSDNVYISLIIKYQDYSKIKLPEETQKEVDKLSKK